MGKKTLREYVTSRPLPRSRSSAAAERMASRSASGHSIKAIASASLKRLSASARSRISRIEARSRAPEAINECTDAINRVYKPSDTGRQPSCKRKLYSRGNALDSGKIDEHRGQNERDYNDRHVVALFNLGPPRKPRERIGLHFFD